MNHSQASFVDSTEIREADARAVMDHFLSRTPLDPVVAQRVRARSEKVTLAVYQKFGELNVAVDLVREVRDDE